ncbi:hypothetical protein ACCO45_010061 [Purpureocillium lilacinum]|uniref:Uncharacterized protein n=1 Tax=Purpureocillium lilacinum TaxID=33203 RepID=A0ACC4DEJ1_PURLI
MSAPRRQHKRHRKQVLDKTARQMRATDDIPLEDKPCCSKAAFERPRLRKCPHDLSTVDWEKAVPLGGGLDGYVWKVYFGTNGPFALKVCSKRLPPDSIIIKSSPSSNHDARANLLAFSDEQRQIRQSQQTTLNDRDMIISTVPPMTQCYGWLKVDGQAFRKMPHSVRPPTTKVDKLIRGFSTDKSYFGIVYEYVAGAQNDQDLVEEVDLFFYRAGFGYTLSPDRRNWVRMVVASLRTEARNTNSGVRIHTVDWRFDLSVPSSARDF